MKERVLLGMSGGVDSAASAVVLLQMGYEVTGMTLRLHRLEDSDRHCGTEQDVEDAARICRQLGIEHRVLDAAGIFEERVMRDFAAEYRRGRTPNPCIRCNRYVKFGYAYEWALTHGYDRVATGHYAVIRPDETGNPRLYRSQSQKDQSYVLWSLTREQLSRVLFPLGDREKSETRALAKQAGLSVSTKPDSEDICFVPDGDYAGFLRRYTGQPDISGDFVDEAGRVLGRHRGIWHYTIGQRKGLGISAEHPLYVKEIRAGENRVVLGPPGCQYSGGCLVTDVNFHGEVPDRPFPVEVKLRYRAPLARAELTPLPGRQARLAFLSPQRSVTPGQSAVFYQGDKVLGGGLIERPE